MLQWIMELGQEAVLLLASAFRGVIADGVEATLETEARLKPAWEESLWDICSRILILTLLWIVYYIAFTPLNRVKLLTEVGWGSDLLTEAKKKKHIANYVREIQRNRKLGELPPSYPNGWFAIAESRFLDNKKVQSVQCLGETFAVFRGQNGVVHVLDAYCPHLGANMAVGGVVKGNCLECPFHGWLFEGDTGACTQIPYAKKVPDFTKVRRWDSVERNGFVFVWFHADGVPPQWEVPSCSPIEEGEFAYRGRTEHHILAHIQEIPENGSDLAHLGHLHVPNIMKGTDLTAAYAGNKLLDIIRHEWSATWCPMEAPQEHVAQVALRHSFALFGGRIHLFGIKVSIEQIGPALVILHFETLVGRAILVQTVTPQEPLRQKVVHQFYSSPSFITPLAKLVILAEAFHVERDIMIWNNKTFLSKPLLVTEDKLISRFRRWYSQFYSPSSPSVKKKKSLEW